MFLKRGFIFSTFLIFSIWGMGATKLFADSAPNSVSTLPVSESAIYSISVEPTHKNGLSTYTLNIYTDDNEEELVAEAVRPLSGKIMDINIRDIDDDGVDELVIMMMQDDSSSTKVHFDVFEFDGDKLSWVEDFQPVSKLFAVFQ